MDLAFGGPLATLRPGHPRLLATAGTWDAIKRQRAMDPLLDGLLQRGERETRAILTAPPVGYRKDGKRLLHVSRVALRRILLLGLHFHLTGASAFAQRAEIEMRAVAAFSDWNPSHFLDVGEMTAALAFGYDWLYDQMDTEARSVIAEAIVNKGLRPGLIPNAFWLRAESNWNQVCLAGLSLGALAVAEEEPTLAAQILTLAHDNNPSGLRPYAPDGVYPEGVSYWGHGTTFETLLLGALQSALGTDRGLAQSPGFLASADAVRQQLGPSGAFFNFSDGVERPDLEPAMWWFAKTLDRPELLDYQRSQVQEYAAATHPPQPDTEADRLLPLAAVWWPDAQALPSAARQPRNWHGRGSVPLAVFRSAWDDPNALYLALKGGHASVSHGHMDAGSFVFEANGVRWAYDLGMQDYLSLESQGVDLWNMRQDAQRWDVFRIGPFCHNTLTVNGQRQRTNGRAEITHFADAPNPGAVVDLSPVFEGQASRVMRGFAFRPGSHVLIRDEISGLKLGDVVRWAMLTRAEVTLPQAQGEAHSREATAHLRQQGQELCVGLHASVETKWEAVPADSPLHGYDAPNPGARLLIAHLMAPDSGRLDFAVTLCPGRSLPDEDPLAETELAHWPLPSIA